ncbi:substrate-binding domain-containing protein [Streptomyces sp. bgisy159]
MEEMAATAARLLVEQLAGTAQQPSSVVFEPELVIRESA